MKKILILIMLLLSIGILNANTKTIGEIIENNEKSKQNIEEILNILDSYKNKPIQYEIEIESVNIDVEQNKKNLYENEMRGVWVASVINIDWPSKKTLTIQEQKDEYIKILENIKKWNMNAVFVQIKPVGDAFYPSKYAPWSEYLTGKQGVAPGYDPLKFMIDEAHKRNIEFHAWFNPYRLTMAGGVEKLADSNIGKKRQEWTVMYGGKLYLNPGIPEVNDYVVESIMEVVKNYNVDGVHLDDYFYPYKIKGQEYNDEAQYRKYGDKFPNKSEWRRNNINNLVEKLYKNIKREKANVVFGISPFGVWRNIATDSRRGSNTNAGIQNYDDLYADVLYWMENGWLDYVAPQIYWNQGFKEAEYNTLVDWWVKYSKETNTKLYIGQAVYKVKEWENSEELVNQINYNRKYDEVKGSIFFSYKSLLENPKNILEKLENGPYKK